MELVLLRHRFQHVKAKRDNGGLLDFGGNRRFASAARRCYERAAAQRASCIARLLALVTRNRRRTSRLSCAQPAVHKPAQLMAVCFRASLDATPSASRARLRTASRAAVTRSAERISSRRACGSAGRRRIRPSLGCRFLNSRATLRSLPASLLPLVSHRQTRTSPSLSRQRARKRCAQRERRHSPENRARLVDGLASRARAVNRHQMCGLEDG